MPEAKRLLQILLAILILAILVLPVAAQDDAPSDGTGVAAENVSDDEVNAVAKDIFCPVCESTPLDVCQTKACADWRELIRTKLGEGQSQDEIFEYFARQYGDGVLANPPRRGMSLVVLWVLPVVLILVGVLFFGRYLRDLRALEAQAAVAAPDHTAPVAAPAEAPEPPARDDYLARIEEELNKADE